MHAATPVVLLALIASPAFAVPITAAKPAAPAGGPSLGASIASSVAGGAASGAVGNLLGKIESLFKRDFDERSTGALTDIVKQAQTLPASDKATVKTALMNKIGTLQGKRGDAELEARAGLGGAIASSVAGGAASGVVGNLLGQLENLLKRDDAELETRAGLGGAIASSVAGGAASGAVGNLLGEVEKLFRRDITDVHDENIYVKRDVTNLGNIVKQAQSLSATDKATVKTALMNKIGTLQTPSKRLSASGAVGTALGGLASVGANAGVSGLLDKVESLFRRGEFEDIHELEARSPLSAGKTSSGGSLGGSIASSVAGGAASGLVGNLLGQVEGVFSRDLGADEAEAAKRDVSSFTNIVKQAQTLSPTDKTTVKNALMTKIGTLQTPAKRLSASGAAGTALGGLASVGANAGVSALLNKVESLFRRDEFESTHYFEARSPLSAGSVGGQVLGGLAGGAASGAVGNLLGEVEKLFRRSEDLEINNLD